jgi:NAD(P)-dependent dehydrogenase (short-subunit alcohol dehydrogenase family)
MTGRRRSYLEYWAPSHGMSVEVAIDTFPQKAEIQRFVQPDEIAELMAFVISPAAPRMTGSTLRMGRRRGEARLISGAVKGRPARVRRPDDRAGTASSITAESTERN